MVGDPAKDGRDTAKDGRDPAKKVGILLRMVRKRAKDGRDLGNCAFLLFFLRKILLLCPKLDLHETFI